MMKDLRTYVVRKGSVGEGEVDSEGEGDGVRLMRMRWERGGSHGDCGSHAKHLLRQSDDRLML